MEIPVIESANYMNSYFCNIAALSHLSQPRNTNEMVDIELKFVTLLIKDVKKFVQEIDVSKSSSIQHLNSTVLKDAFLLPIPQLTHLFNCSIGTSIFASDWKSGKVIPIPKTKQTQYATNWRPICLLSLPGKILEKFVHRQLYIEFYQGYNMVSLQVKVHQLLSRTLCCM